jgi:hypothetical protein
LRQIESHTQPCERRLRSYPGTSHSAPHMASGARGLVSRSPDQQLVAKGSCDQTSKNGRRCCTYALHEKTAFSRFQTVHSVEPEGRLRAESTPTESASGRTGVPAKADIPLRVRDRLRRPHAILGGLPHVAVTLKAASRRTGHNSNPWPSVGSSTSAPLSFPTKTFRLTKIGSSSPFQSRVD